MEGLDRSGSNRDVIDAMEAASLAFGRVLAAVVASVETGAAEAERAMRLQQTVLAERHA